MYTELTVARVVEDTAVIAGMGVMVGIGASVGAAGAWGVRALSGGRIDYVEKVLRLGEDRSFSHEKATRDFGFEPELFETGLRREVEEYLHGKR